MSVLQLSDATERVLGDALRAEYAAIWVCGLASAFAGEAHVAGAIGESARAHREQRDRAQRLYRSAGMSPPTAHPAYRTPRPLEDQNSAIRVLISAERDCTVGWRAVLERAEPAEVRKLALDGLTTAASRATRWRLTIGDQPAARAFPGDPSQ